MFKKLETDRLLLENISKEDNDFMLSHFSDDDIHRIDAHIYYENERSITLAKKLGFSFYGEREMCVFREQEYLHQIYTRHI